MLLLKKFKGDLHWIHAREGHAGKAYWPGGQSGVTLDPGVDLGYIDQTIFNELYSDKMDANQLADAIRVSGYHGEDARRKLSRTRHLKKFRISREDAEDIFPYVADEYWNKTVERWPDIITAPPCVHTAVLSVTYNRGPENRHLKILDQFIESEDWEGLGTALTQMQQNHKLPGIRKRRRLEGELVLRNHVKESYRRQRLERMEPLPLERL